MQEALLIISALCNLNTTNVVMPKEEKIECIGQYADCLIGPNGKFLKDQIKACESKYKTFKKNNERRND